MDVWVDEGLNHSVAVWVMGEGLNHSVAVWVDEG